VTCNYTPIEELRSSRFQGVPLVWLLVEICKKYALTPTPPAGREPDYLQQRAQWGLLSSGGHGGTRYSQRRTIQSPSRNPLWKRPTLLLATAIMVALGDAALLAPHGQHFPATRPLESSGPHSCCSTSRSRGLRTRNPQCPWSSRGSG
jgi:hypothetical protein